MKKKVKNSFTDSATGILKSITSLKKELRLIKNEEIRKLTISEKEQIEVIRLNTKKEKQKVLDRYEKKRKELGKSLLRIKNQELQDQLDLEKKSLRKTNSKLRGIKKSKSKLSRSKPLKQKKTSSKKKK